jgi:large subunit ribosomal protein L13
MDIKRKKIKLDAEGKAMGRLASEIAKILIGKHRVGYRPNVDSGDFVEIKNAGRIKLTGNKISRKVYYHYSGYPGGLKTKKLSEIMAVNPADALRRAVKNMLPKNKLQNERLKRLTIIN